MLGWYEGQFESARRNVVRVGCFIDTDKRKPCGRFEHWVGSLYEFLHASWYSDDSLLDWYCPSKNIYGCDRYFIELIALIQEFI